MNVQRLLTISCIFGVTLYLSAELVREPKTCRYYSIPASPEINQNEYHALVWHCKDIMQRCAVLHMNILEQMGCHGSHAKMYDQAHARNLVIEYLQRMATPTSMRLLEDLNKNNFAF